MAPINKLPRNSDCRPSSNESSASAQSGGELGGYHMSAQSSNSGSSHEGGSPRTSPLASPTLRPVSHQSGPGSPVSLNSSPPPPPPPSLMGIINPSQLSHTFPSSFGGMSPPPHSTSHHARPHLGSLSSSLTHPNQLIGSALPLSPLQHHFSLATVTAQRTRSDEAFSPFNRTSPLTTSSASPASSPTVSLCSSASPHTSAAGGTISNVGLPSPFSGGFSPLGGLTSPLNSLSSLTAAGLLSHASALSANTIAGGDNSSSCSSVGSNSSSSHYLSDLHHVPHHHGHHPYLMSPLSPRERKDSGGSCSGKQFGRVNRMILDKDSDEYRRRRERNNQAVKKSRMKSKSRTIQTIEHAQQLKRENEMLETKIKILTKELTFLKDLFLAHSKTSALAVTAVTGGNYHVNRMLDTLRMVANSPEDRMIEN